jgi:hypothetical protein
MPNYNILFAHSIITQIAQQAGQEKNYEALMQNATKDRVHTLHDLNSSMWCNFRPRQLKKIITFLEYMPNFSLQE